MSSSMGIRTHCGGQRGCGTRKEGGVYACVSTSPWGKPVEHFVLDPPKSWAGEHFRSPLFAQRKDGIYDLIIWIGEKFYPFVPDFLEEVRTKGISRQLSSKAPLGKLTAMESRMVLVHANAIAPEHLTGELPISDWCACPDEAHSCTFNLWSLSGLWGCPGHEVEIKGIEGKEEIAQVTCPACSYQVRYPWSLDGQIINYEPGAFAAFYITHFETVSQEDKADPVVVEQCKLAGYELLICTE